MNALIQRGHAVLNDKSIDAQSRAIIRYAMETHDPWLARLVKRVDARRTLRVDPGESLTELLNLSETSDSNADESGEREAEIVRERLATLARDKIEALAEIICGAGNEAAGALLVLMSTLQSSTEPKALANLAKHLAFTRCGELNLYGMVEAQIAAVEAELLT